MSVRRQTVSHSSRVALAGALAVAILCLAPTRGVWKETVRANGLAGFGPPKPLSLSGSKATTSPGPFAPDTGTTATVQPNDVGIAALDTGLLDDHELRLLTPPTTSAGDRWAKFEQEYGIKQESGSAFGRMIQNAKYGLDTMCFTAMEGAKELEFTHDFGEESDRGTGVAQPDYSVPMVGRLGQAQLESEVTVHDPNTGEAFVGLKLAIPFGPGLGRSSEVPRSRLDRGESSKRGATQ